VRLRVRMRVGLRADLHRRLRLAQRRLTHAVEVSSIAADATDELVDRHRRLGDRPTAAAFVSASSTATAVPSSGS
jgi:hypothetical protein